MTPALYPPPPWRLRGTVQAALWRVPRAVLPGPLPAGARPLGWGRTALLATARADWAPGGDLAYRELVVAVPVRLGRRIGITITAAWVDSPAALAGGRDLWAIPKRLGRFGTLGGRTALTDADGPVAASRIGRRSRRRFACRSGCGSCSRTAAASGSPGPRRPAAPAPAVPNGTSRRQDRCRCWPAEGRS